MTIPTNCAGSFSCRGAVLGLVLLTGLSSPAWAQFLRPVIRAFDCTPYTKTEQICQDLDTGILSCGNGTTNSTANCGIGGGGGIDTEAAQDAIGTICIDTATIDCIYTDATPSIEHHVKDASVTFAKIQDVASDRLICRDTTGTGSLEACSVGPSLGFSGAGVVHRSALTGDVTAAIDSNATTIANDAVTNAKLANMPAWSLKARNTTGTGDPTDLDLGTTAEETVPATTDWLLGWIDTGELRKIKIGNLPIPAFIVPDCTIDPQLTVSVPPPWICIDGDGAQGYLWNGIEARPFAFIAEQFGLNQTMALGNSYTGAQSFATGLQLCDGGGADCTGRAGWAFYTGPSGPVQEPFDTNGNRTTVDWTTPDGLTSGRRIGDGTGSDYYCELYTSDGLTTYTDKESCRPRSSGQTTIRATDGTQCSAVESVEIRSGNGAHSVVRCADNDNGFLYLVAIDPPDNWVTGSLASLTVWVVSDHATPTGTVVLEPSVHCLRPDTDTLVTAWTAGSTASVTLDTQYKVEKVEWTNLAINGTCTSTSLIAARLRFEADSTANGLGVAGDVFLLADTIGVSVFLGTNR